MRYTRQLYRLMLLLATLALIGTLTSAQNAPTQTLTIWSVDIDPTHVDRQQELLDGFRALHPEADIRLIVLDAVMMEQVFQLANINGRPPELLLAPLELIYILQGTQNLNSTLAGNLINQLDTNTFSAGALRMVRTGEGQFMAIPAFGTPYLLLYRRDLFRANGLAVPDNFERIRTAATALHDPDNGIYGFCGPSDRDEMMINELIEELALANGADFVNPEGDLTVATPAFVQSLDLYITLMTQTGPATESWTENDVRRAYLAGNCAMAFYESDILDELAGLQERFAPTCPECANNSRYLSDNTGIVSAVLNTPNALERFEMVAWVASERAGNLAWEFLRYFFDQTYISWLDILPEVRLPLRNGQPEAPDVYAEAWLNLEIGIDSNEPLRELYSSSLLDALLNDSFQDRVWRLTNPSAVDNTTALLNSRAIAGRMDGGSAYPRFTTYLEASHIRGTIRAALEGRVSARSAANAIEAGILAQINYEQYLAEQAAAAAEN